MSFFVCVCVCVSQWSVVDELSKLSSLVKLSIHHNLLTTKDRNRKTADQVLIAKMGRLETLNNSQVPVHL